MLLRKVASLKLTLVGMGMLAITALAAAGDNGIDTGFASIPISILVVNLLAALLTNRSFRTQTGLLVFHIGLLIVFMLAGLTVLTRFDGHAEVVQGGVLETSSVVVSQRGWLHRSRLDRVRFEQGAISVDYHPMLLRQATRSTILVPQPNGRPVATTIGDHVTETIGGYRVAATFNKGFAVIVGWQDDDGRTEYGSIHFPSYPENDWNQRIDWTTPAGETLNLELELGEPPIRTDGAWTLGHTELPFTVLIDGGQDVVLAAGESIELAGGRISVHELRLWMGYRIDYLPLLPWMLAAALLAVCGLAMHFRVHYLRPRRQTERATVAQEDALYVTAA